MIENSDTINKYYEHFDRTHFFIIIIIIIIFFFFFGGNQKKNTKANQQ